MHRRRFDRIHTGTVSVSLRARAIKRPRSEGPGYDIQLRSYVVCTPANCPGAYPFLRPDDLIEGHPPAPETDLELLSWERSVDGALRQAKELFMLRLEAMLRHRRGYRVHRAATSRERETAMGLPDTSSTY